eukprot:TRINITY_DN49277_c0_g1_i1.p1 TRINITY_DN49277_c0_g1~~TRINITY_DN49277_c0_g1_i1.p1  ORF type:complete len:331 (+),score=50.90 TRINITY_DN49277_c0_g1_i1:160-1152(+)
MRRPAAQPCDVLAVVLLHCVAAQADSEASRGLASTEQRWDSLSSSVEELRPFADASHSGDEASSALEDAARSVSRGSGGGTYHGAPLHKGREVRGAPRSSAARDFFHAVGLRPPGGASSEEETPSWELGLSVVLLFALFCMGIAIAHSLRQLQRTINQERPVRRIGPRAGLGLSQQVLERLQPRTAPPVLPLDSSPGQWQAGECCVCLDAVPAGASSFKLQCCARWYHYRCLVDWLARVARCPMCREPVLAEALLLETAVAEEDGSERGGAGGMAEGLLEAPHGEGEASEEEQQGCGGTLSTPAVELETAERDRLLPSTSSVTEPAVQEV